MAAAPESLSTHQTHNRPFLPIQQDTPPWCGTAECIQESTGAIDLSVHLREIATKRHRLYFLACTIPYDKQHFHLRIAGVLPARNKMVALLCPVDPPVYRLIQVPSAFQLIYAKLRDGTIVHPLSQEKGQLHITLSGILISGSTACARYLVHHHLVDLGLAGPTAPILQWSSFVREPVTYLPVLLFHVLTALPAELLAVQCPPTSWAFEASPVMTLAEWEAYPRLLSTSHPSREQRA